MVRTPNHAGQGATALTDDVHEHDGDILVVAGELTHLFGHRRRSDTGILAGGRRHPPPQAVEADELDHVAGEDVGEHGELSINEWQQ